MEKNKYRKVDPADRHVPERLRDMVEYLNKLIAFDRVALSVLLERTQVPVNEAELVSIAPSVITRPRTGDTSFLTGLGILAGFVNTGGYRLFAEEDDENPGWIFRFGVFRVRLDGDPREMVGVRVRTWPEDENEAVFTEGEKLYRKVNALGKVDGFYSRGNQVCYEVRHESDGTAGSYLPSELEIPE